MHPSSIAVIAFDGISPFHLSIPCSVFGESRGADGIPLFSLKVCSAEFGPLTTTGGFTVQPGFGLRALASADVVVVPSWRDANEIPPTPLLNALRRAHQRGATIVGLCLGSFVLAAAGLLDGRPATTHWARVGEFVTQYPTTRLDPDVLYVDDGDVVTSAGVAAGIDCCLHLLRKWRGAEVAARAARRMVVPAHRQGGQAQYIEQAIPVRTDDDRLGRALAWVQKNLQRPHTLDSVAERAHMSRRSFTRHFRLATGTTLNKWLVHQRLLLAQRLLEQSDDSIDLIAERAGFGTAISLRQHFGRAFKVSPSHYRQGFRGE